MTIHANGGSLMPGEYRTTYVVHRADGSWFRLNWIGPARSFVWPKITGWNWNLDFTHIDAPKITFETFEPGAVRMRGGETHIDLFERGMSDDAKNVAVREFYDGQR